MRRFLLTLDMIDILYLVYSNFCANKITFKGRKFTRGLKGYMSTLARYAV